MDAEVRLPVEEILGGGGDGLIRAVSDLYDQLDRQVIADGLHCRNCGSCCCLRQFDHRLYVTTVELAYFVAGRASPLRQPQGGVCPYLRDGWCTARSHRPVGCRLFFCDPDSARWQQEQYQALRPRLIALGETFDLPYAYAEWLEALALLAGDPPPTPRALTR